MNIGALLQLLMQVEDNCIFNGKFRSFGLFLISLYTTYSNYDPMTAEDAKRNIGA